MSTTESMPFHVDISRIVQVLANQIYQSPLALLRENCQNAYDAILQRKYTSPDFAPEIRIHIANNEISVQDNGIGMSREEVKQNYWRAGSSGKNNAEARAAGVVGTFGIGAMANFGIADSMEVETERIDATERIRSSALKAKLSTKDDCIDLVAKQVTGQPGTTVVARSTAGFNVDESQAINYVAGFVQHVDIPVYVNDKLVSQKSFHDEVPQPGNIVHTLDYTGVVHGTLQARVELAASAGEVWVRLSSIVYGGGPIAGEAILRQNLVHLRGFRSKFALATSSVSSSYKFGGVADFSTLEPTAGREALTTSSIQFLQQLITSVDSFVSLNLAAISQSNSNAGFVSWAAANRRFDLCRNLEVRTEPDDRRQTLATLQGQPNLGAYRFYAGQDAQIIRRSASEDTPLVVVSRDGNRRACELGYIQQYCKIPQLDSRPKVEQRFDYGISPSQRAMVFQLTTILKRDYFVDADVAFGKLSEPALPFLIDPNSTPLDIVLSEHGTTVAMVLKLYEDNYQAFTSFLKDFVRSTIFPQIADRVPSSTRQGAESFLQLIEKPREEFSIDSSVTGDLSEIWQRVNEGTLSPEEAAARSRDIAKRNIQVVSQSEAVRNVMPDVLDNQANLVGDENQQFAALPAITRPTTESDKILLTIGAEEQPINGFRTFLAITDRVREDRGDFFLQPHFTQIVWGGQKVLYIFQHHSREFSLYYEVLAREFLSETPGAAFFHTSTIAIQNQTYIPIPDEIAGKFLPDQGPKEFHSRCDLLYPEIDD